MSFSIYSNGTLPNVKADIIARAPAAGLPQPVTDLLTSFINESAKNAGGSDPVDAVSVEVFGHFGGGPGMSRSNLVIKLEPYIAAPAASIPPVSIGVTEAEAPEAAPV